jgi:hypothetical protein
MSVNSWTLIVYLSDTKVGSPKPSHPGNQRGANDGVIHLIQHHYKVPAANFTLDRDGTVYVHAANPVWRSGVGTFTGKTPWHGLGIPADMGNRWMLGVKIISKGVKPDFTAAQKESLVLLALACQRAAQWPSVKTRRLPRHRDWTQRKPDILYANSTVQKWITTCRP